jgi:hypothetical protein
MDIENDIVESTPGAKQYSEGKLISKNEEPKVEETEELETEEVEETKETEETEESEEAEENEESEESEEEEGNDDEEAEEADDKEKAEEVKPDDLSIINTFFEGEYESVDAAKAAYQETLSQNKEKIEKLASENSELKEQIDPLKYFGGDKDAYVLQQLRNTRPDLDPTALTTIMSADVSKLSSLEVLALQVKLNNPGAVDGPGQATAKDFVYDKFDLDPDDIDGMSPMQKSKMDIAANEARKEFSKLSSDIEVPDVAGLTAKRQEEITKATEAWTPVVKDELVKGLDSITFTAKGQDGKTEEVFKFNISDDYKAAILDATDKTIADLASKGIEVNDQTKKAIVKAWKDQYVLMNLPKIMQSYTNDKVAKMTQETFDKYHNPKKDNKKKPIKPRKSKSAD